MTTMNYFCVSNKTKITKVKLRLITLD